MILHAVPSFIAPSEYGAGNWKAVEATRLACERSGLGVTRAVLDEHDPLSLLDEITDEHDDVLVEYSMFPELLDELRRVRPACRLHVRTINAEPYQHLSRQRGNAIRSLARLPVWKRTARLLVNDVRCRRTADTLLGISDWDDSHYWRWLPGKAAVLRFPYFSPWPELRPDVGVQPWAARRSAIVSMGGNFDPSGLANVANFQLLADRLPGASNPSAEPWEFLLTWWSQWHEKVPDVHGGIHIVRDCREPWDLLCQVRALAVLTPFGYGLKTTVVDGLAAGCHVIVHRTLANRLPADVAALCIPFDPERDDMRSIASRLSSPPPQHGLNERLWTEAAGVLKRAATRREGRGQRAL